MSDQIKSVRGMPDILPDEIKKWQYVEAVAKNLLNSYSYNEIPKQLWDKTK